jgi:hypothetical protein
MTLVQTFGQEGQVLERVDVPDGVPVLVVEADSTPHPGKGQFSRQGTEESPDTVITNSRSVRTSSWLPQDFPAWIHLS